MGQKFYASADIFVDLYIYIVLKFGNLFYEFILN